MQMLHKRKNYTIIMKHRQLKLKEITRSIHNEAFNNSAIENNTFDSIIYISIALKQHCSAWLLNKWEMTSEQWSCGRIGFFLY